MKAPDIRSLLPRAAREALVEYATALILAERARPFPTPTSEIQALFQRFVRDANPLSHFLSGSMITDIWNQASRKSP